MTATDMITMGPRCRIDECAFVGYVSGRKLKDQSLIIGADAVVRRGTVIYLGGRIGDRLETGHNAVIREENIIGHDFSIWNNSTVDYGCVIGNNVKIHCNVYVAQFTVIEDDVFIAPGVSIANDLHPLCSACMKGPVIKKGTRIGAGAVLLPHITIGENCLVAAGAVVTKDLPKNSVAVGNPARVTKTVQELSCRFGIKDKPYIVDSKGDLT